MTRKIRIGLVCGSLLLGSLSLLLGNGMAAADDSKGGPTRARLGSHLFPRADRDANGSVELAEAQAGALSLFDQLDADRDGGVLRAEAEASARRLRGQRLEQRFEQMDLDRDGTLRAAELAAKRGLLRFDANQDGVVSRAELREVGQRQQALGRGRSWLNRFETWDGDGDGRVTRGEVEREVTRSFTARDVNRDGSLSRREARGARQSPGRVRP